MSLTRQLNLLYGQLQGYARLTIDRKVRANAALRAADIQAAQQQDLRARVAAALASTPMYAEKVKQHCGSLPDPLAPDFAVDQLPIWSREDQNALFATQKESPIPDAFQHGTGGSSGTPLRFWITRESYEWRCAVSQRGYSWAGAEDGQRVFYVWGAPALPISKAKQWKLALYHRLLGHHIFNSFHFTEEDKAECCRQIVGCQPRAIVGYAGNLVDLAAYVQRHPQALPRRAPAGVTAAEGLDDSQVAFVEEFLVDKLYRSYGSREFMLIGMENGDGKGYYLTDDNLYVEVVDDADRPCPPGETGRILVTDLHNLATPFIRYEIGDLGSMAAEDSDSALPFRRLATVSGRIREVIRLPGGEKMTALFIPHLMKEFPWINGYQIHQKEETGMEVLLRATETPSSAQLQAIDEALRPYVGSDFQIGFRQVAELHRKPNGKTPIVVWEGD